MHQQMITSESNSTFKLVKGLQQKKNRVKTGCFVVEGLRIVQEALDHGIEPEAILYSDSLLQVRGGKALLDRLQGKRQLFYFSEKLLNALSDTQNSQGILAVIPQRKDSWEALLKKEAPFLVVLDRIQDPGNLGTIIRTAEGAGADGVILTKGCVDPYNSKTLRSTMGAIFHLPVLQWEGGDLIQFLGDHGIRTIATGLEGAVDYHRISYQGGIALIFGNEANGITPELLGAADVVVKIPIVGKIESLNASIAAGVLIYKALEDRS